MLTRTLRTAKRRQGGFTILEVVLALTVLMMMTLMFAAVVPVAIRGAQASNNYNQAALLAQHKIDQLRGAGFGDLDYNDLLRLGIIDASPTTGPFSFTATDHLLGGGGGQGYFPPGSSGTIQISPYGGTNNSVDYVTVTISWPAGTTSAGSYSASTMIISMIHN